MEAVMGTAVGLVATPPASFADLPQSPPAVPAAAVDAVQVTAVADPPDDPPALAAVVSAVPVPAVTLISVGDVLKLLAAVPLAADGPGMIDQLRGLEDLKSLAGAQQARLAVAFDLSQRQEQAAAGVPVHEQGAGVGAQVALARRESPARGSRLLGLAKTLTGMPDTFAGFRRGSLNEWRATLVVKETICLSAGDRAGVDEELAADTGALDGMGDKAIIAAVRAALYRRDPASVARRSARAVTERSVSLRPAADTMTYLTALLPVAQGVAAYAALSRDADTARSAATGRAASHPPPPGHPNCCSSPAWGRCRRG